MLKFYNASYILVYTTISDGEWANAGGDEGKWVWMAAISGKARQRFIKNGFIPESDMWNETLDDVRRLFGNFTIGTNWVDNNKDGRVDKDELEPNTRGQNTTIYKLMRYAVESWKQQHGKGSSTIELLYFIPEYIAGLDNDGRKYGGVVPLVCLYKINWEKYYGEHPSG